MNSFHGTTAISSEGSLEARSRVRTGVINVTVGGNIRVLSVIVFRFRASLWALSFTTNNHRHVVRDVVGQFRDTSGGSWSDVAMG